MASVGGFVCLSVWVCSRLSLVSSGGLSFLLFGWCLGGGFVFCFYMVGVVFEWDHLFNMLFL